MQIVLSVQSGPGDGQVTGELSFGGGKTGRFDSWLALLQQLELALDGGDPDPVPDPGLDERR